MITRRTAILIATVPAWGFGSTEFWNQKKRAEWSEDEVKEMMTKSPWAKEVNVSYSIEQGSNAGRSGRMANSRTMGGGSRPGSVAYPGADSGASSQGKYKALVRWESALPIREAAHTKMTDDLEQNYVISLSGDLPMMGPRADDDQSERAQKIENAKQYTKLDKKGDPIFLSNIAAQRSGTFYYFLRNDLLSVEDKQVTFLTKLGPIEVKAKFNLKEMLYRGKLEL